MLSAVLQPVLYLIQESMIEEYETLILPSFRTVFTFPKSVQATIILLENLHIILEKTPRDEIRSEVLPMLYSAFDSTTVQVQVSLCNFHRVSSLLYLALLYLPPCTIFDFVEC